MGVTVGLHSGDCSNGLLVAVCQLVRDEYDPRCTCGNQFANHT